MLFIWSLHRCMILDVKIVGVMYDILLLSNKKKKEGKDL